MPEPSSTGAEPSPPTCPPVAVVCVRSQFQVVGTDDIAPGQPILYVDGVVVARPTRYTIQVGEDAHVEGPAPIEHELDHHPWRFLNHACSPNAVLRGRWLVALRAIGKGEQVTFDYTTTEYDMACPFACHCGSPDCLRTVRGFRHLSPEQQIARAPWLAEHLRRRLREGGTNRAKSGA